jgi:hypothetical protein
MMEFAVEYERPDSKRCCGLACNEQWGEGVWCTVREVLGPPCAENRKFEVMPERSCRSA